MTVGSKYVLVVHVKEMKLYCPERQLRTKKARGENQERKTDKGRKRQINKKKPYGTINAEVYCARLGEKFQLIRITPARLLGRTTNNKTR